MRFWKDLVLFYIGGILYVLLELVWRGRSHPTMFLLGGLCFLLINALGRIPAVAESPLLGRAVLSAVMVTTLELLCGLLVNVVLQLNVWDYSHQPLNFMGQICPLFFLLWIPVSLFAILAGDYLQYLLFGVPLPRYRLF